MPQSATTTPPTAHEDVLAAGHLGELTHTIPPDLVDTALEATGGTEQRFRRLPSRIIVYLLLAGTFFADQGWAHVFDRLTSGLAKSFHPAKSALVQAMRRVGPAPLRELFTLLSGYSTTRVAPAVTFAGRLVVAVDGTQMSVPDTEANLHEFPKSKGGPNGPPGYPTIRLLALVATGTRQVIDAVFGPDTIGELTYVRTLMRSLRSGMVFLADRNFATYDVFRDVTATGADFLIRAKDGKTAMKLPVLERLEDGSYLSRARGVPVRVIHAVVQLRTESGTRRATYTLITSLLDPHEASAERLLGLYHRRWEIETTFCEMKDTILDGRVLRARYPAGVHQEVWALLCAYQGLRTAMTDAILGRADVPADRLSFTAALLEARDQIIHARHAIEDTVMDLVGTIGAAVLSHVLPPRRLRYRPRVVKRALSRYPAKSRNTDRRTYSATLRTEVLTGDPDP